MTEESLYSAPQANLVEGSDKYYQPKALSISGRLDRSRLFSYGAVASIINYLLLLGLYSIMSKASSDHMTYVEIADFISMLPLVYFFLLAKRRLNDTNISGWWLFLIFVPVGNFLLILYVMARAGSPGVNKYGAVPTAGNAALALALVVVAFAINIGIVNFKPAVFSFY